jgi:N-hydroxyarylamine O-acetyltransferase
MEAIVLPRADAMRSDRLRCRPSRGTMRRMPPAATEWAIEELDVPAYLRRIGHEAPLAPTAATLLALHRAHVDSIPFENLDILLGRPIELSIGALTAKLLLRRRGGYCYEHNLLFAALLERAGLEVARLAARVVMGGDQVRPRTHMLLTVRAEGRQWLADVGFGGHGPLGPVPLEAGAVARHGGWTHRLEPWSDGPGWTLQTLHPDGWLDLYHFTTTAEHLIDYQVASHYTSTHPSSPFTRGAIVQRSTPDRRFVLRDGVLVESTADATAETRTVAGDELGGVLTRVFGIELSGEELDILRDAAA